MEDLDDWIDPSKHGNSRTQFNHRLTVPPEVSAWSQGPPAGRFDSNPTSSCRVQADTTADPSWHMVGHATTNMKQHVSGQPASQHRGTAEAQVVRNGPQCTDHVQDAGARTFLQQSRHPHQLRQAAPSSDIMSAGAAADISLGNTAHHAPLSYAAASTSSGHGWPGADRNRVVQQQELSQIPDHTHSAATEADDLVPQSHHQQEAEDDGSDENNMLAMADFAASTEDVLRMIEQLVLDLVTSIAAGQLPELTSVSTSTKNVILAHPEAEQADDDMVADDEASQQRVLRLGSRLQRRTMLGNGGQQAYTIARVLQVLDVVHSLLQQGRTASQRDIYYTLLGPPLFNNQRELTSTIQTVLSLLRVPRASLGITAASKGAVAGRLLVRSNAAEAWQDCSLTGPAGRSIPGETAAIQNMALRVAGARFILVVEKDAIFQRLVEDRLFDRMPCIIITGRGMPDIATRYFLAALVSAANAAVPVLGLVDWNPAGVQILLSYKLGTAAMGLEAARYAVPSLCWLGIHADMLEDVPSSACQDLTNRDKGLITNLRVKLRDSNPDWVSELEEMESSGLKADIEALYSVLGHQGLAEMLSQRILAGQYLS